MVQVILLRSLILSSIMCLALSSKEDYDSDYVSTESPKHALPAPGTVAASSKDPKAHDATIPAPAATVGSNTTIPNKPVADDSDMMPDEPAFPVEAPAKEPPVVSTTTTTNTTAKGTLTSPTDIPAVKAPGPAKGAAKDTPATTSPAHKATTPVQAVPAPLPGIMSADGKCTCPTAPDVPAESPPTTTTQDSGSTPPATTPEDGAPVSTDTSSTSPLKVPAKVYLIAVAAVVGINSLCT